jgi:hypothetical protein
MTISADALVRAVELEGGRSPRAVEVEAAVVVEVLEEEDKLNYKLLIINNL